MASTFIRGTCRRELNAKALASLHAKSIIENTEEKLDATSERKSKEDQYQLGDVTVKMFLPMVLRSHGFATRSSAINNLIMRIRTALWPWLLLRMTICWSDANGEQLSFL